jgi:hypothetical protein
VVVRTLSFMGCEKATALRAQAEGLA